MDGTHQGKRGTFQKPNGNNAYFEFDNGETKAVPNDRLVQLI
jgi:hypothetical protein